MISAQNIIKTYGNKTKKTQILNNISLTIADQSFTVILGASGSGKSTLLYILSGLERPDSGSIQYADIDITSLSDGQLTEFRKEKIGFVFQQYYLLPNMTVEQNVRMGADLAGNPDYRETIRAVGLENGRKKYPDELSGGEQQRVSIARALAKKPDFLFLDEPTGALDEKTGRQILAYIADIHQRCGITMVLVTHNQNIAEMADTVIRMNSGRIETEQKNQAKKTAYEIGW